MKKKKYIPLELVKKILQFYGTCILLGDRILDVSYLLYIPKKETKTIFVSNISFVTFHMNERKTVYLYENGYMYATIKEENSISYIYNYQKKRYNNRT